MAIRRTNPGRIGSRIGTTSVPTPRGATGSTATAFLSGRRTTSPLAPHSVAQTSRATVVQRQTFTNPLKRQRFT